MTFRLDSDILYLYGKILDIDTNHKISPDPKGYSRWISPDPKYNVSSLYIDKIKKPRVGQFTSHCKTFSHREVLIEKLKKYIDVHVYGRCNKEYR